MAGVLVGDVAEKYREVHNSGSISCDLGYIVGKAMSFKRNGTRHQAQGARLGEKGRREREELSTEGPARLAWRRSRWRASQAIFTLNHKNASQ